MENSYTRVHYDETVRPYTPFARMLTAYLAGRYFPRRSGRLLDVCCGRGEFMELFAREGFDTYGVDKDSVAAAKSANARVVDVETDDLPFPDGFFDYVLLKSAIEHVRNVYFLMNNLSRVLRPGGKILIITGEWKCIYKVFYDDVDHKTPFTRHSLRDLLARHDFRKVSVEPFYYLPYTWRGRWTHLFPPVIAKLFPVDFPPTVRLNPLVRMIKFSRDMQIIGYGEK